MPHLTFASCVCSLYVRHLAFASSPHSKLPTHDTLQLVHSQTIVVDDRFSGTRTGCFDGSCTNMLQEAALEADVAGSVDGNASWHTRKRPACRVIESVNKLGRALPSSCSKLSRTTSRARQKCVTHCVSVDTSDPATCTGVDKLFTRLIAREHLPKLKSFVGREACTNEGLFYRVRPAYGTRPCWTR